MSGCLITNTPYSNYSADPLFYGGGFRWTPRADRRCSPCAQFMFGGRKVTREILDREWRQKLWMTAVASSASIPSGVITLSKPLKMVPASPWVVALIE